MRDLPETGTYDNYEQYEQDQNRTGACKSVVATAMSCLGAYSCHLWSHPSP